MSPALIIPRAPSAPASPAAARAKATAREFEAVFLGRMLDALHATVGSGGPLGDPGGAWRGLLAEKQADAMARAGGIGLAAHVEREILRLTGGKDGA